ncbi:uncharacterized protein DS421_16g536620 [Arachis hypogaea]|nr:uncharacterized protein DS421_16g536620 [Arachis hypogaea]
MEGRLKFDDEKNDMKVDSDPFDASANFAKPFIGVNMVGFSYEFDTVLGDFETNVGVVHPGVDKRLLEFLMQQRLKDQDVSLCPRCNAVFDADAAAIFEKERMKKERTSSSKTTSSKARGTKFWYPSKEFFFSNEPFTSFRCAIDTELSGVL